MIAALEGLKPVSRNLVYDLLEQARFDLSDWENVAGGSKKANPKYCYNWAFEEPGQAIALCLWHVEIQSDGGRIIYANNVRANPAGTNPQSVSIWRRRADHFERAIRAAYLDRLPVRAIILDGDRRDRDDPEAVASSVSKRALDEVSWAVTEYDFETGDFLIVRGVTPIEPHGSDADAEVASFQEGEKRRAFRSHRHREWRARREKIEDALRKNDGRLICEVPRCGFDFEERYGELGRGYAHVHHLEPLGMAPAHGRKTKLVELAIVCPNCHAMIHLGGECRSLEELIKT